jgi:hypothetical protein
MFAFTVSNKGDLIAAHDMNDSPIDHDMPDIFKKTGFSISDYIQKIFPLEQEKENLLVNIGGKNDFILENTEVFNHLSRHPIHMLKHYHDTEFGPESKENTLYIKQELLINSMKHYQAYPHEIVPTEFLSDTLWAIDNISQAVTKNLSDKNELRTEFYETIIEDTDFDDEFGTEENFEQFLSDNEHIEYYSSLKDIDGYFNTHSEHFNTILNKLSDVTRFAFYKEHSSTLRGLLNEEGLAFDVESHKSYSDDVTHIDRLFLTKNPFILTFSEELLTNHDLTDNEQSILIFSHILNGNNSPTIMKKFAEKINNNDFSLSNYYLLKNHIHTDVINYVEKHSIEQNPQAFDNLSDKNGTVVAYLINNPEYLINLPKHHHQPIIDKINENSSNQEGRFLNKIASQSVDNFNILINIKKLKDHGFIDNHFIEKNVDTIRLTFGSMDAYRKEYDTLDDIKKHLLGESKKRPSLKMS